MFRSYKNPDRDPIPLDKRTGVPSEVISHIISYIQPDDIKLYGKISTLEYYTNLNIQSTNQQALP
jgi:hypothetical protein